MGPAPFHVESTAVDNQLIEGLLGSHLRGLPGGKLDERALLPLHDRDRPDLSKLIEVISEIRLSNGVAQTANIQGGDGLVFRGPAEASWKPA